MCEKISGYKTFAHIFVCHSTRLSEAGFILSTAWHLHHSVSDEASHNSNYILLADQPKSRVAAKTPLLTRVRVARQKGSGGILSARSAISLSNDPPPYAANRTSVVGTFDAVRRDKERMTANGH